MQEINTENSSQEEENKKREYGRNRYHNTSKQTNKNETKTKLIKAKSLNLIKNAWLYP